MPLTPDEFYRHAVASADETRRLPLSRMTGWEISPFEPENLRVSPLRPPVTPEPPRDGEDPGSCRSCQRRDEGIWLDDRWRLTRATQAGVPLVLVLHPRDHHDLADLPDELAAELGVLTTHIARHVEALLHIGRCHVYRIGDGGRMSRVSWNFGGGPMSVRRRSRLHHDRWYRQAGRPRARGRRAGRLGARGR